MKIPNPPRDERIETLEMKVLNLEQMIRALQAQLKPKPRTNAKPKPKLRATSYPFPKFKGRARYMKLD